MRPPTELFELLLKKTEYLDFLAQDKETYVDRLANINELESNIQRYIEENPDSPTLDSFLEDVALMSDIDNYNQDSDAVVLMTLHSAKGLEFPVVYIPGMENGIFPGTQSLMNNEEMEEERRLAYVGITRAKEKLILTNSKSRMLHGQTSYNPPSDFIGEIPPELCIIHKPKDAFRANAGAFKPKTHTSYSSSVSTAKASSNTPSYNAGDRVNHKKFGDGMVISASKMGNDVLLEIAFDTIGTKKLMAKVAPLKKI